MADYVIVAGEGLDTPGVRGVATDYSDAERQGNLVLRHEMEAGTDISSLEGEVTIQEWEITTRGSRLISTLYASNVRKVAVAADWR